MTAAFSEIYAERSMERMSNQPSIKVRAAQLVGSNGGHRSCDAKLYGSAEGSHATPSEVALTWHNYPETHAA